VVADQAEQTRLPKIAFWSVAPASRSSAWSAWIVVTRMDVLCSGPIAVSARPIRWMSGSPSLREWGLRCAFRSESILSVIPRRFRCSLSWSSCFSGVRSQTEARWMLTSPSRSACRSPGDACIVSCLTLDTFPADTPAATAILDRTSNLLHQDSRRRCSQRNDKAGKSYCRGGSGASGH